MIYPILYLSVHMELIAPENEPNHHVTVVMFTLQKDTVTQVMMQPQ